MDKPLDETLSADLATLVNSKAKTPFDNAYRAALKTSGSLYVQGFLVVTGQPSQPLEHGWIELDDRIADPTFPYLQRQVQNLFYFPAQRLTVKQLKQTIEESQEDYPEDDPLPIYGAAPYEYYGDKMLGGKEYQTAYDAAAAKCRELNQPQRRSPEQN
jgi:hypothetical protein